MCPSHPDGPGVSRLSATACGWRCPAIAGGTGAPPLGGGGPLRPGGASVGGGEPPWVGGGEPVSAGTARHGALRARPCARRFARLERLTVIFAFAWRTRALVRRAAAAFARVV